MEDTYSKGDKLKPWSMHLFRVFIAFDQLANVALLGFPDETISARLGRAHMTGKPKWFAVYGKIFVDYLFYKLFDDENHCIRAIEHEESFKERPELWKWYKSP